MTSLDPATIVPSRAPPPARRSTLRRFASLTFESGLSLALNAVVVGFVVRAAFGDVRALPLPEAIPVELVSEPPPVKDKPKSSPRADDAAKAELKAASASETPALSPPKPAVAPATQAATPGELPASTPQNTTDGSPPPTPVPPALEGATNEATPQLVEVPTDPRRAAEQALRNVSANALPDEAASKAPVEAPPPPVPHVVSASEATDAVPPASTVPSRAEPTAEEKRQAVNTAKLAAALPFSPFAVPDTFRAALSGSGSAEAQAYRGAVYGSFHKADEVVEAAQARHLHGQAVVAFSIDDTGALTSIQIAISSGDAAVDTAALDYIRKAAPFPPPPPGAPRSFSPAIGFGLEEH